MPKLSSTVHCPHELLFFGVKHDVMMGFAIIRAAHFSFSSHLFSNRKMQPAEPMGRSPDDDIQDTTIPEHLPVQMALAPEQKPYSHTHVIRRQDMQSEQDRHAHNLSKHSLSPEQLGVVGYVKDVAGFVKDAVQEAKDKRCRSIAQTSEQHEADITTQQQQQQQQPAAIHSIQQANETLGTSPPSDRSRSPLAEVVTGLFPGLDPNAHGCTHADEIRHQLPHPGSSSSPPDNPNALHR